MLTFTVDLETQTWAKIRQMGRVMETKTRWRDASSKGKNGLRHVHTPSFQPRTRFHLEVFLSIYFAPFLGNLSYPLSHNFM